MRHFAALVLLSILGFLGMCCHSHSCSTPRTSSNISIWIDNSFPQDQKDEIIRAYKTIECSTNSSLFHFEFFPDASIGDINQMMGQRSVAVVNTTSSDPRIVKADRKKVGKKLYTIGLFISTDPVPTVLLPVDRLYSIFTPHLFYKAALHEGIHSIGIENHSKVKTAIMNANMDGSDENITKADLEAICSVYGCDASSFQIEKCL